MNNSKFAYTLIKYLIHLSHTIPNVNNYLTKQRKEVLWLESFLEAKVQSNSPSVEHMSKKHLRTTPYFLISFRLISYSNFLNRRNTPD